MSDAATAFASAEPAPTPTETPAATPATPAATEPTAPSGLEFLPESYRDNPNFTKFKDAEGLAKSYLESQSLIGKSIRIPGKDAGEKTRAEFYEKLEGVGGVVRVPADPSDAEGFDKLYNKMGRPEKAEDYSTGTDEQKQLFHSLGLSESQARALASDSDARSKNEAETAKQAIKEAGEQLRTELGDGFDRSMKNAQLAALQLGGDEFVKQMQEDQLLGNNVALIKLLAEAGEQLGKNKVPLNSSADAFNLTKQQAEEQIAELRDNEAYQNREQWALDKMRMLYTKANPQ